MPMRFRLLLALVLVLTWLLPSGIASADTNQIYLPSILIEVSGDRIAYSYEGNLFVVKVDGLSDPKALTTDGGGSPWWSPDNREIRYWRGGGQGYAVVTLRLDGSLPPVSIPLTLQGDYYGAVWSPDGTKVLLTRADNSTNQFRSDIYVINADGTGLQQLTTVPGTAYAPLWSPDGKKIAYEYQTDYTTHIYVMNADGSNLVQVSQPLPDLNVGAVWSPAGDQLAFQHDDKTGYSDIYTVNVDGSNLRNLTEDNAGANDFGAAWSPDGTRIAFVTYRNADWYLYIMNADGSNPIQLSPGPGFYQDLHWSPTGAKVAFIKDFVVSVFTSAARPDLIIPVTERDLGVVDTVTRTETRLTFGEQSPIGYVWSR